jgi:hypothetical protein
MLTAVLEGLVNAVKGFSCFLLRGCGFQDMQLLSGAIPSLIGRLPCYVRNLILQLAVGLLVN